MLPAHRRMASLTSIIINMTSVVEMCACLVLGAWCLVLWPVWEELYRIVVLQVQYVKNSLDFNIIKQNKKSAVRPRISSKLIFARKCPCALSVSVCVVLLSLHIDRGFRWSSSLRVRLCSCVLVLQSCAHHQWILTVCCYCETTPTALVPRNILCSKWGCRAVLMGVTFFFSSDFLDLWILMKIRRSSVKICEC